MLSSSMLAPLTASTSPRCQGGYVLYAKHMLYHRNASLFAKPHLEFILLVYYCILQHYLYCLYLYHEHVLLQI